MVEATPPNPDTSFSLWLGVKVTARPCSKKHRDLMQAKTCTNDRLEARVVAVDCDAYVRTEQTYR